jgi:hypothetical protein
MRSNLRLVALALLLSFRTFAQVDPNFARALEEVTTVAPRGPEAVCVNESIAFTPAFYGRGANCTGFITKDGTLGPHGRVIEHHMSLIPDAQFYREDHPGAIAACPNWPALTQDQRTTFWIWFIAAIAWKESTCITPSENSAATHGTALGYLQLNADLRARRWRGGTSGNSCAAPRIHTAQENLLCGLEILNEQLKGPRGIYRGNGNLFGRGANSYWQHLRRPDGGIIMRLMSEFPHCRVPPVAGPRR